MGGDGEGNRGLVWIETAGELPVEYTGAVPPNPACRTVARDLPRGHPPPIIPSSNSAPHFHLHALASRLRKRLSSGGDSRPANSFGSVSPHPWQYGSSIAEAQVSPPNSPPKAVPHEPQARIQSLPTAARPASLWEGGGAPICVCMGRTWNSATV